MITYLGDEKRGIRVFGMLLRPAFPSCHWASWAATA
jgi:hypothetical protein